MSSVPTPSPKDKAIAELTTALQKATAKLKEQDAILKQMAELPGLTARVTHLLENNQMIIDGHVIMEVPKKKLKSKLEIGTWLHVSRSFSGGVAIIDTVNVPEIPQMVMTVAYIDELGKVYLEAGPGSIVPLR